MGFLDFLRGRRTSSRETEEAEPDYAALVSKYKNDAEAWVFGLESQLGLRGSVHEFRLACAFAADPESLPEDRIREAYSGWVQLLNKLRNQSDTAIAEDLRELMRETAYVVRAAKCRGDIQLIKDIEESAPHTYLKCIADSALHALENDSSTNA